MARLLETDLHAIGNALDLLDDGVGERVGVLPERVELLLDPGDAFRRGVFPENLVVLREGALGLVDRAKEAGLRSVGGLDDSRLAVDEDAIFRNDTDLNPPAGQQIVKSAIAVAMQQRLDFGGRFVPALLQRGLADVLRTATSAASSSLLQTICTLGIAAISSPTSSKIELRK